jgi:GNAT superfamily N-acetyltransferase
MHDVSRAAATLAAFQAPAGAHLRLWAESDMASITDLSTAEGWSTPRDRPAASLASWQSAWPVIIAEHEGDVVGFLRALSDDAVSIYVAEVLVASGWRGRGLGRALLDACQQLVPATRLDLLAMPAAAAFYERAGFTVFAGFRRCRIR